MSEIILSRGYTALVDEADYDAAVAAGPWHVDFNGTVTYAARNVRRPDGSTSTERLHTFLTGWSNVDHRNQNGLDNRRLNLRAATQSENIANARRRKDNTSGFRGVTFNKRVGRWAAQITVDRKTRGLGYFATAEDAARAYDAAAIEAWGEFARPNFPVEAS